MRLHRPAIFVLLCAMSVLLAALTAWSQASRTYPDMPWLTDDPVPNFAGSWSIAVTRSGGDRNAGDDGPSLDILHSDSRFVVTRKSARRTVTSTYNLDGSPTRNETTTAGGDIWVRQSRAHWVEGAIVIETIISTPNGSFSDLETWFRDVSGQLIVASLGRDIRSSHIMGITTTAYEKQP